MAMPSCKTKMTGITTAFFSPRVCLVPLFLLLVALAVYAPWDTPSTVDERTYFEMIDGVARHGLPFTTNGPHQRFKPLQARWNVAVGDRLWGGYVPLYAFLAAPAYIWDGIRGIVRMNFLLLVVLALLVFALSKQLFDDEWAALAAAYLVIFGTWVWSVSFGPSPYTLFAMLVVASVCAAWRAVQARASHQLMWAGTAGLAAACALVTHAMAASFMLGLLAALAFSGWHAGARRFTHLARLGCGFAVGAAVVVIPFAWLNKIRFGTLNLLHQPCVWVTCELDGIKNQSVGALLPALPLGILWLGAVIGLWRTRRPAQQAGLLLAAVGITAVLPGMRSSAWAILSLAWSFLIDVGTLPPLDFLKPVDGLGVFLGGALIKSAFQTSPILVLVFLVGLTKTPSRQKAMILAPLSAMILAICVSRTAIPKAFALGYPFISMRYLLPGLPLAAIAAVSVMRELPWRWWHWAIVAATIAVGGVCFTSLSPQVYFYRVVALRVSLGLALVTPFAVLYALKRRSLSGSAWVAITLGYSLASVGAIDWPAFRSAYDQVRADRWAIEMHLPKRAALVGFPRDLDPIIAAKSSRDLQYLDLHETMNSDPQSLFKVINYWLYEDHRPVYWLQSRPLTKELFEREKAIMAKGGYEIRLVTPRLVMFVPKP